MASNKYLFVGSRGCGKTSLILALLEQYDPDKCIPPTQGLTLHGPYIDLPGNYCESSKFYPILSVCAQQASFVVLVIGADQSSMTFPDGFAQLFIRPVIGVITKADIPDVDCKRAETWLHRAGVQEPWLAVSARTGAGVTQFRRFLERLTVGSTGSSWTELLKN